MWIWQIIWLLIFGLLIVALIIGLRWGAKRCRSKCKSGKTATTGGAGKGLRPLKPRTPDDCSGCRNQEPPAGIHEAGNAEVPAGITPYAQVKSPRGRKKQRTTAGYACPNEGCVYFGVSDEGIHALVHCGSHGKQERISDLKCQACGRKFSVRYGTALYRLKTASAEIAKVMTALAEGVGVAVARRIFGHSEFTIQTWLARSGMQAQKLHERWVRGLHLGHVQLDEVRTVIRQGRQIVWIWIAIDACSKLIAAMQIGPRTQDMAQAVVHRLKDVLATGRVPVFSSDGLALYFYALTSHFGQWVEEADSRVRHWKVSTLLLYGQVKKH